MMVTKYSDMIAIRESAAAFRISPENSDWRDFIPNEQFNKVLKTIISSVYNNNANTHKSFWINGTYGSGKSHAGAVIKHLLCDEIKEITKFIDVEYNDKTYALLRADIYNLRKTKRLFPISLYGIEDMAAAEDLSYVLQNKILESLNEANLDFDVQTDFDCYINDIEEDGEFWSLIINRSKQLKAYTPTVSVLVDKLLARDMAILRLVKQTLRKQNKVIPVQSNNLGDWIFNIQDKLASNTDYSGLLLLWDEFTNVMKSPFGLSVLEKLQGISERTMKTCNNSYFLFISHPSALDSLDEKEGNKTKGRYHYMNYQMEAVSAYKIMSRKLVCDKRNPTYLQKRRIFIEPNDDTYTKYSNLSTSSNPSETKQDLYNLFPIHPGTANLATFYAREAGSSSRSVFNFIGVNPDIERFFESEEEYINNNVITADYLWDYVVDELSEKITKFGAVIERFNSHKDRVAKEGAEYCAVFKAILLLNAFTNIAKNAIVSPSIENITLLFKGTYIEPKLDEIFKYLDNNGIIQRAPDDLFTIRLTTLPTKDIEEAKQTLRDTQFKYTSQVINYGPEVDSLLNNNFTPVTRPYILQKFSIEQNEYLLINKIKNGRKSCHDYELFIALLFARNMNELLQLESIVKETLSENNDKLLENTLIIVYETVLEDQNYERFIDYLANASVAQSQNSTEDAKAYRDDASKIVNRWVKNLQRGECRFYLRNESGTIAASKISHTINTFVAPIIFSSGPDSYGLLRLRSRTFWEKFSAKATVRQVLTNNTKTDISNHCQGKYILMTLLLQHSVDEDLNWIEGADLSQHPLKLVSEHIDNTLSRVNKNVDFNLAEKLRDLTLPPFGLYQSSVCMGMVAFALRKYTKQIYNTNGKPLDANNIADAIILMFQCWEDNKLDNKLNFMFETKEANELCELFIEVFHLRELEGYNDISSLTDARWALTHEYIKQKGFPLWSLKYSTTDDEIRELVDKLDRICNDKDFRSQPNLLLQSLKKMKQLKFELNEHLKNENSFKKGFWMFVRTIAQSNNVQLNESDEESILVGIGHYIQNYIGCWTEHEVEQAFLKWSLQQLSGSDEKSNNVDDENVEGEKGELEAQDLINKLTNDKKIANQKVDKMNDILKTKEILRKIIEETRDIKIIDIINNNYD